MVRFQGYQQRFRGTMDNTPNYRPGDSRGVTGELGNNYQERVSAGEPQSSLLSDGLPVRYLCYPHFIDGFLGS